MQSIIKLWYLMMTALALHDYTGICGNAFHCNNNWNAMMISFIKWSRYNIKVKAFVYYVFGYSCCARKPVPHIIIIQVKVLFLSVHIVNIIQHLHNASMTSQTLTRWRLVPSEIKLGSMGNVCHSKIRQSSIGYCSSRPSHYRSTGSMQKMCTRQ